MRECLKDGEAHLWCFEPDTLSAPHARDLAFLLLSPEERAQNSRISLAWVRQLHLAARILSRTLLSQYSDVRPECWTFTQNEHGRPEIAYPAGDRQLRFNLSHTRGCVVCLIARDRDVGVDVEPTSTGRHDRAANIAEHFFSKTEISSLHSLPASMQHESFLKYWTLKESYIKARGVGLSLGLSGFSFHFNEPSIRISFEKDFDDDPGRWQFSLFRSAGHLIAASVSRDRAEHVRIHLRDATTPVLSSLGMATS